MASVSKEELERKQDRFSNRKKIDRDGAPTRARHYDDPESSTKAGIPTPPPEEPRPPIGAGQSLDASDSPAVLGKSTPQEGAGKALDVSGNPAPSAEESTSQADAGKALDASGIPAQSAGEPTLDASGIPAQPGDSTPQEGTGKALDALDTPAQLAENDGGEMLDASGTPVSLSGESTPQASDKQTPDSSGVPMPPAVNAQHLGDRKNQGVSTPKVSSQAPVKAKNSKIDRTSKGTADKSRDTENVQTTLYTLFVEGEITKRELSVLNLIYKLGGNDNFVPLSAADVMKNLQQKSATWVPGVIKSLESKQKIKKKVGSASTKNSFMLSL